MTNMCLLFLTVTYNVTLDYSHQTSTCNVRILKEQQDSSVALHLRKGFVRQSLNIVMCTLSYLCYRWRLYICGWAWSRFNSLFLNYLCGDSRCHVYPKATPQKRGLPVI